MTEVTPLFNAPIIASLAKQGFPIVTHAVDPSDSADSGTIIGFHKPTDVLVSRWFPGYRVSSLSGKDSEEAVAHLLAASLVGDGSLERFRLLLSSPVVPMTVIAKLFPRASQAIPARKYKMSEAHVRSVVAEAMPADFADPVMVDAYTQVFTRVLASPALDMIQVGEEQRIISTSSDYALNYSDVRRLMLVDALRGVFSEARIGEATRGLDSNATPQLLAESLAKLFRQISHVVPEIQLRLEHIDIALACVRGLVRSPELTPVALRAHGPLVALSSIANLMIMAVRDDPIVTSAPESVTERKEACTAVLSAIQSAPSVELISLSSFATHVGCAPVTTADGTRRGIVLYGYGGQSTKLEVVDVVVQPQGRTQVSLLPQEYARLTTVATAINNTVGTVEATTAVINIIADELARENRESSGTESLPMVVTYGLSQITILLAAMAAADAVAVTRLDVGEGLAAHSPVSLVFACSRANQWRSKVLAATAEVAFFADPIATLLYNSPADAVVPKPLPSRAQTIGAAVQRDVIYLGDVAKLLDESVQRPFRIRVHVTRGAGDPITLNMNLNIISHLLRMTKEGAEIVREDAFYAAVAEPGVDMEYRTLFATALAYSRSGDRSLADLAKSWLIETLAPLVTHPAVTQVAERALNQAVLDEKVDLRVLAASYKETLVRAYFGTALAVLCRFGKIDANHVSELMETLPVSGISVRAQLALATMPVQLPLTTGDV